MATNPIAASLPAFIFPERTCVYRYEDRDGMLIGVNVNDEIGLPAFGSYTISEYLEDLQAYDGIDGRSLLLEEHAEPIDLEIASELMC